MNIYPSTLPRNDRKASFAIIAFSIVVFLAVTILERVTLDVDLGFDPHIFALISAVINAIVAVLLIIALQQVRAGKIAKHRKTMQSAMYLSVFFLVFYIMHHLFTGSTLYGDVNHNGVLSEIEKNIVGNIRYVYYFIISTHITLAGLVMPFVLFSAYRALVGDIAKHKQLVRYTYPIWLYVAITGVVVYVMIQPFY